jgi:hypothetical protein
MSLSHDTILAQLTNTHFLPAPDCSIYTVQQRNAFLPIGIRRDARGVEGKEDFLWVGQGVFRPER